MTLDLEKMAREFVIAHQPEPAKCMNCGKTQPMTVMATVDAYCPRAEGLGGHVYEFTVTTGEEAFQAEIKRLVSFARSVQKASEEHWVIQGKLREARAQAYEEIAEEAATWKEDAKLIAGGCPHDSVGQAAYMGEYDVLTLFEEWLRSESKRIRESK